MVAVGFGQPPVSLHFLGCVFLVVGCSRCLKHRSRHWGQVVVSAALAIAQGKSNDWVQDPALGQDLAPLRCSVGSGTPKCHGEGRSGGRWQRASPTSGHLTESGDQNRPP